MRLILVVNNKRLRIYANTRKISTNDVYHFTNTKKHFGPITWPNENQATAKCCIRIEVLNVKVHMFVLLLFASLPDCSQNQTAVSYTLRLLSDF
jgi:hypothetical protein